MDGTLEGLQDMIRTYTKVYGKKPRRIDAGTWIIDAMNNTQMRMMYPHADLGPILRSFDGIPVYLIYHPLMRNSTYLLSDTFVSKETSFHTPQRR